MESSIPTNKISTTSKPTTPILVTGATGYVASNIIKLLLERGYKVRGTVRSLSNKKKYEFLEKLVPEKAHNLEFVEADLQNTSKWFAACQGVEYVFHVASPFPLNNPKHEDELIKPAVEGTLNVLKAAVEKGVKKVIVTSSLAAVYYGHQGGIQNEDDWSVEEKCTAYSKSKLRAERAAWDFWRQNIGKFELATVNPGLIIGPVFEKSGGTSEKIITDFMNGNIPGVPRISCVLVDVRDVAECHIRAMFSPGSNGKRYLCASQSMWMKDIAAVLKGEFGKFGYKVPSTTFGKCLISFAALFDKNTRDILPELNLERKVDPSLSMKDLGMTYIKASQSLVDMGYSLIKIGALPDKTKGSPKEK